MGNPILLLIIIIILINALLTDQLLLDTEKINK